MVNILIAEDDENLNKLVFDLPVRYQPYSKKKEKLMRMFLK